jgi:hypothetical protein
MDEVLPGQVAPVLPYVAAQTVTVGDLDAARSVIERNGVATRSLPSGFFVRAEDCLGANTVFVGR